ncbi:LWR-salt protein [Halorubrum sp. F4]|uniref:LWR-salt protein n=1 Tax=Halorubrum sp. F4 TaxID=2989715 RepID=UPI002480DBAE|nr:LWR-salt protein [Halorubrum sp. F4]
MNAAYVFRVTFRIDPDGASADPDRFETTVEIPAVEPDEEGWMLFRDRLWRGEVGDEPSARAFVGERLGVDGIDVERVAFRELRTDRAYLDALEDAIAAQLPRFNADDVDEALHKYLGSSIHVRE